MYFCKNCGEPFLIEENSICDKCGVYRNCGTSFCHNCGNHLKAEDEVCPVCGVDANNSYMSNNNGFADFELKYRDMNGYNSGYGTPYTPQKSMIAAGILALFFGSWGVHNFYLGYTKKAVTQLTLSIVGYCLFCVGIGMIITLITGIWGFAEAIMLFTRQIEVDGHGQRLIG